MAHLVVGTVGVARRPPVGGATFSIQRECTRLELSELETSKGLPIQGGGVGDTSAWSTMFSIDLLSALARLMKLTWRWDCRLDLACTPGGSFPLACKAVDDQKDGS